MRKTVEKMNAKSFVSVFLIPYSMITIGFTIFFVLLTDDNSLVGDIAYNFIRITAVFLVGFLIFRTKNSYASAAFSGAGLVFYEHCVLKSCLFLMTNGSIDAVHGLLISFFLIGAPIGAIISFIGAISAKR